jgi:hypothetical protein
VRLLGYCREDKEVLLVEYMAKGSLENHLFRSEPRSKFVAFFSDARCKLIASCD